MKSTNSIAVVESLIPSREFAVKHYGLDAHLLNPAIYVGTYLKYACGSIDGEWVDISMCSDYEEFIEVCKAIHQDEEDPEFMFQDFMNFPESLYCESCFDELDFERILEYASMDEEHKNAYEAFADYIDKDVDEFRDKYVGKFDSEEAFAESAYEDQVEAALGSLAYFFDYKALARDIFIDTYVFINGFVFYR